VTGYHINVFWSTEDKCWIADVPDLEHCSAHGATPIDAVREVGIAVEAWLAAAGEAGKTIPKPRYRPAIYAAE
jgi:predicted RNase H-like HicB family nuclease